MSTFSGFTSEFPYMSIDRFEADNWKCTCFFLSHCHADHMVGLENPDFFNLLNGRKNVNIYCSEISKLWLCRDERYKDISKYLVSLPLEQAECLVIKDADDADVSVSCTLIPSGHCPGSVMFLLEDATKCILYTGDFRWKVGQVKTIKCINTESGVKRMDAVYVDTTFCDPLCYHIPDREECLSGLITTIEEHFNKSSSNIVRLDCRAQLGYEYLFCELAKYFNTKIHVSSWQWAKYRYIEDLHPHLSPDPHLCKIHACRGGKVIGNELRCGHIPDDHAASILVVLPTAIYWTRKASRELETRDCCVYPDIIRTPWLVRACFSTHSSYSEIADLLSYLKPKSAHANVIPTASSHEQITKRLEALLEQVENGRTSPLVDDDCEKELLSSPDYKPLGKAMVIQRVVKKTSETTFSFGSLTNSDDTESKNNVEEEEDNIRESEITFLDEEEEIEEKWTVIDDELAEKPVESNALLDDDDNTTTLSGKDDTNVNSLNGGGNDDDDDIIFVEEKPVREVPDFLLRPENNITAESRKSSSCSEYSDIPSDIDDDDDDVECIDLTEEDDESFGENVETNKRALDLEDSAVAQSPDKRLRASGSVNACELGFINDDDDIGAANGNDSDNRLDTISPDLFMASCNEQVNFDKENGEKRCPSGDTTDEIDLPQQATTSAATVNIQQSSDSSIDLTPTKLIPFSIN